MLQVGYLEAGLWISFACCLGGLFDRLWLFIVICGDAVGFNG